MMTTAALPNRYGRVAIALHWLIAILVIANIALGLYFPDLPNSDASKFALTQLHKSIGLTVLVLSLLRLGWRLVHPVPPLPATLHPALKWLAHATHYILYFLIIAIPLSGWALVSDSPLGLPTMYFGWFEWPHIPFIADMTRAQKHASIGIFDSTHIVLAWSAIVLVPLHVAAALFHQFVRRDDVLLRMLPFTRTAP